MNKTYQSQVKYYNQHGEGVVFINNKPFYIYGVILDELIEFKILKEFKTYGIGELINIIKPSQNRVDTSQIKNTHLIGGYDLIHMNAEEQKNFKINTVINNFKQIAKIDLSNNLEWKEGLNKFKYRNKITLHDGCFYKKKTNEKIKIYDFLLSNIKWDPNLKGDIIYRQLDTLIFGKSGDKKYTTDSLFGFKFRVGLDSFYQINKEVTEIAYKYIHDNVIPNQNTLDLYCGIGTIGIILSNVSKKVVGVEVNTNSYLDAIENQKINDVKNINFINGDVKNFVEINDDKFDNVILDPARSGVGKKTMEIIKNKLKPKKIIYMSCNSATQAADIKHVLDSYDVEKGIVLDMFPQTYHIETILVLNKK